MKIVYLLVLLHEEEGIEDPRGVFTNKEKLQRAIENLKIDLGATEFKEGSDFKVYEIPSDEV